MYPPNHAAALLDQLETERAISELMDYCLELWLPLAEAQVLRAAGEPPPDPSGAADAEPQWAYLMEAVVLYGIGLITAHATEKAFTALTDGLLLPAGDAVAAAAVAAAPAGLPSRDTLTRKVRSTLRRRITGMDPEVTESRISTVPSLRGLVSQHVDDVRGRLASMVDRAFRRITGINQEVPDAPAAREDTREALDPGEWQDVADETGQTQATAALNTATTEAANMSGLRLEKEWVAILDTHTRAAHAEADGQKVPLGEAFSVGGEDLRFPGDPLGSYDNTINCRCRVFASVVQRDLTADGGWCAPSAELYELADSHADGTMAEDTSEEKTMAQYRSFTSVLAVIGEETDDGRMFASDIDLTFRDFPLPLQWQKMSAGGHYNSYTVAVIESAEVVGTEVVGAGYMLNTPEAAEAATEIEHGVTAPSVDLGSVDWELRNGDGDPIDWDDLWDDPDMKVVETVLAAKMLGATLVAIPAFGSTSIKLGEMVERGEDALVAAAGMEVPVVEDPVYDPAFFTDPGFTEPTLPHITADGRIQGHLAAFNVCHIGIQDTCVMAPRSQTDYAWFHTSPPVKTSDGSKAKVGRLTVGGGHAGPRMGVGPAVAHYDDVGTAFALVHVGEDEHGIWFSGVAAPGATQQQIAQGLSAPLSGDWRRVGGNLELVAALAVNTPGFPIVASGATDADDAPMSLVAAIGPCRDKTAPLAADPVVLAKAIVAEMRAADRREAEARELLASINKRETAAILDRMG